MSDPPGLPSALGIEAVEWFAQEGGGENLTVRVTGRWRRRRPASTAQPTLVVEVHGYRHRYPAMPEPPSVTGTAPGTWRMTFSVPAWIAPHLGTRASLQLGGVVIPLPAQLEHVVPPGPEPDPDISDERRLENLELLVRTASQRAREAEDSAAELAGRVLALEEELEEARREPARLTARLAELELARQVAEQRAHAEQSLREDAQDELALRVRQLADAEGPRAELSAALARVRELESELAGVERRLDEAENIAAAAIAARRRAERRGVEEHVIRGIRAELAAAIRTPAAPERLEAPPVLEPRGLELERLTIASRRRTAVTEAEPVVPEPTAADQELASTLAAFRRELDELREIAERERAGHEQARSRAAQLERELHEYMTRSVRAYDAIEQLRERLETVRLAAAEPAVDPPGVPEPPVTDPPEADPLAATAGPVEAARLEAALSRLREAAPAVPEPAVTEPAEALARATRPWLAGALRGLLKRDPAAAGRLVLALLPAQRLVHSRPVAYDLVLVEDGCVQVTVAGAYWSIERHPSPRPSDAVQFSLTTDLPSLARFVATGRPRRRLRRAGAQLSGDRTAARALPALAAVPLSVSELLAGGVQLDPLLALSMAAAMIEPAWTKGERFTIAYQPPESSAPEAHLQVLDGAPPAVAEGAPSEPVSTTIACPHESLIAVLDGRPVPGAQIGPDKRPLTRLQGWMKRAQSD